MSIAFVGKTENHGSGSTISVSNPGVTGNYLIGIIACDAGGTDTISLPDASWHQLDHVFFGGDGTWNQIVEFDICIGGVWNKQVP